MSTTYATRTNSNTMTATSTAPQPQPASNLQGNLGYVLDNFVNRTDGVHHAQTVSADGMHLAASGKYDHVTHDTFAAIASGLASLTEGASENFGLGAVDRQIIETTDGWVLLSRLSNTATIGVVADSEADLGLIGYEMTRLAKQLGSMLSPEVVDQIKQAMSAR